MGDLLSSETTAAQYGFASNLKRHNAVLAEHKSHTALSFASTLVENMDQFHLEKLETDIKDRKMEFQLAEFVCPKCKKGFRSTALLRNHCILHFQKQDAILFDFCSAVRVEVDEMIEEAKKVQQQQSRIRRQFEKSEYALSCDLASPLATFLSLHHLKIYLDEQPINRGAFRHKLVTLDFKKGDEMHKVFFSFTVIERNVSKIKNLRSRKLLARKERECEERCASVQIVDNDIFLKRNRTEEADQCLIEALGLPKDVSEEVLQETIDEMTVTNHEKTNSYTDMEDENGRLMTKEQRKLISTLSNGFMHPTGYKRRCTLNRSYTQSPSN